MNLQSKLNKATKLKKEESSYKTIYLKKSLIRKVEQLEDQYGLSFSNVVSSMVESSLEELEAENSSEKDEQ